MNRLPAKLILKSVAMASALFAAVPPAAAQPREVSALNRICRASLDGGDDLRAANVCKRVHEQIVRLAPGTPEYLESIRNLAELKRRQDNNLAADEMYTEALGIIDAEGEGETLVAAQLLESQADAKIARGKVFEAEPALRRALKIREARDGETSLKAADTRVRHAMILGMLQQFQDAHVEFRRSLTVYEHAGASRRAAFLETRRQIAELLSRQYRMAQAETEYRRLLDDASAEPVVRELVVLAVDRLAWIASETGRTDDAVALYQRELVELGTQPDNALAVRQVQDKLALLMPAPPVQP